MRIGVRFFYFLQMWIGLALAASTANAANGSNLPVAMSKGHQHSCALTSAGGAVCWGRNDFGQLGNNSTANSNVPVAVVGLSSGVRQVEAGGIFTCALLETGSVKCWGYNNFGQLGNGTTNNSWVPVNVLNLDNAISLAAGASHICAVTAVGGVRCWGYNSDGQIGDGSGTHRTTPVNVLGVSGAIAAGGGYVHSCALLNNGRVKCWGNNQQGQLGNGTINSSYVQVDVQGLTDATGLAVGFYHNCVRTQSNGAKCWGYNAYGQRGTGDVSGGLTFNVVNGLSGVASISSAPHAHSTCATLVDGSAWCWGYNNAGQLGTGDTANRLLPTRVSVLNSPVTRITAGYDGGCAFLTTGVQCWGNNSLGQLGSGNFVTTLFAQSTVGLYGEAPVAATPLSPVTAATPVYTWKAAPGASGYRLRINGITSSYSAAQVNCPGGVGLCTLIGTFLTPGSYAWQVQSFNEFADGPWSGLLQFVL